MQMIALLVCFLFLCHTGHRHHTRSHPAVAVRTCNDIQIAYSEFQASAIDQGRHEDTTRDKFVRTFPPEKQHHVLECIGDTQ